MSADAFTIGQTVVTRRGKRGTVEAIEGDAVHVRFGGKVFPMRAGQLVRESSYERMQAGARCNEAQARNAMRGDR
jgi:hypothetical protein